MKHSGLVTTIGINEDTGRALWQASCACGWAHPQANESEANARRALSRHIRSIGVTPA